LGLTLASLSIHPTKQAVEDSAQAISRTAAGTMLDLGIVLSLFFTEFISSFAELGALHVEGWAVFDLFDRSRRVRVGMAAHYLYFHFFLLRNQNKKQSSVLYYNTI